MNSVIYIGVCGQKGGISKSGLAKLLATELTRSGMKVLLADMDVSQSTSVNWNKRRVENDIKPLVNARKYDNVSDVISCSKKEDVVVFDGAPHATRITLEVAKIADLMVLPVGGSLEDLEPQIDLAHEMVERGIDKSIIRFVLCRMGTSKAEVRDAREYVEKAGYKVSKNYLSERTAFRRASIEGRAFSETNYKTLNSQCEELVQELTDALS